jgi:hypothetical protein
MIYTFIAPRIEITSGTRTLTSTQTTQLTAMSYPTPGSSGTDVTSSTVWSSDNPAIATVSGSGLITAVSGGVAVVRGNTAGVLGLLRIFVTLTPITDVPGLLGECGIGSTCLNPYFGPTNSTVTPKCSGGNISILEGWYYSGSSDFISDCKPFFSAECNGKIECLIWVDDLVCPPNGGPAETNAGYAVYTCLP